MKRLLIIFSIFLLSCSKNEETIINSRSFYMGFSPWPYDNTAEAIDWVYSKIREKGDIISQHMEEGVPWPESYSPLDNQTAFSQDFLSTIKYKVEYSKNKKVVLQISPLNINRNGIALYRGSGTNQPLPPEWQNLALNCEMVKTAFLNYAIRMKEYFKPDFMLLGVEVNLIIDKKPELWTEYLDLQKYVYSEIKKLYPNLQLGVSVFCVPYFPEWTTPSNLDAQLQGLKDISPYIDFLAFSVHPFMSSLMADTFPDNYFQKLFSITNKPIAISESSYPAQKWATLSAPFLTFNGSEDKQSRFLSLMFSEANKAKAKFVIWYSVRDYDALWNTFDEDVKLIGIVWRDTGLFDENGNPRKVLRVWDEWFGYELHQ